MVDLEGSAVGKYPLGRGDGGSRKHLFGLTMMLLLAAARSPMLAQVAQPVQRSQAALTQVAATTGTAGQPVRAIPPEYRLGPGDEISVTFPLNQELNHDGPIGPDGRFTMPLIGDLLLEGDTVNEATLAIANALREGRIVADARPSLTIRHYNASIYVGGEIHQPGVVTLSPGMDALQAVIAAGGMLDTAKTKRIALIRRTQDGHASIMFIDLRSYLRGATGRVLLQPRDVVFVPKSSIAEADSWVDQYLNKLLPFNKSLNYNTGNYGATTTVVP